MATESERAFSSTKKLISLSFLIGKVLIPGRPGQAERSRPGLYGLLGALHPGYLSVPWLDCLEVELLPEVTTNLSTHLESHPLSDSTRGPGGENGLAFSGQKKREGDRC
jgi:hypothetical protein